MALADYSSLCPTESPCALVIDRVVELDPVAWSGYCLRPLQVVDGPGSEFMAGREMAVAANLAYEISKQGEDGAWVPAWSWGERFPEVWARARREWCGVVTVEMLLLLKRFGCVEGA